MSAILGLDCKLYRLSSGTRAAWPGTGAPASIDEIPNVRDVTLNLEMSEADVTTRTNGGWRATIGALLDASLEWEMIADTADTDFTAIQTAFFAKTTIPLAVLNGTAATVGTQGLWADFRITGFTRTEALEDVVKYRVTAKPTYSSVPPAWITTA